MGSSLWPAEGHWQTSFEDAETVEEALCFGWVDSKPGKLHDERSMRHFRAARAEKRMR